MVKVGLLAYFKLTRLQFQGPSSGTDKQGWHLLMAWYLQQEILDAPETQNLRFYAFNIRRSSTHPASSRNASQFILWMIISVI